MSRKPKSTPQFAPKLHRGFISRVFYHIRIFLGIDVPDVFLIDNKLSLELAFVLNGKKYYWCPDPSEMPSARALAAQVIYSEMRMGVTKEYLVKHCDEVNAILNGIAKGKFDIGRLTLLHNNLKERAELLVLPEYIFKLASVVFMEKNESPYGYDYTRNQAKIKEFKESAGLDFFLTSPLKKLIPSLSLPENDTRNYLRVVEEIDRLHWEILEQRYNNRST